VVLALGLVLWFTTLIPLTALRQIRPPAERLGFIPSPEVTYFASLEYRQLFSELLFFNTIFYYGAVFDSKEHPPDYKRIYQFLDTATRLNPYNSDCYHFGQAILTWDGGMIKEVNGLLMRGAKKRHWDFYLPFFLGFNHAFFLKDPVNGARFMAEAARLNPEATHFPTLASRLYYQGDQTDLAISYLKTVYKGTRTEAVRKGIRIRIEALERIAFLERSVDEYGRRHGRPPGELEELVRSGMLRSIPPDPYGGSFYLDQRDGRIKTTSNLANPGAKHEGN
jgi:hypothetical protein